MYIPYLHTKPEHDQGKCHDDIFFPPYCKSWSTELESLFSLFGKSINNFKNRSWNSSLTKQYTLIIEQTLGTKVLVLAILGMVSDLSCVGRSGLHGNEKVSLGSRKNCGTLLPLKTDKLKSNAASVFSINKGGRSSELVPYLKSCHGNLLRKVGHRYPHQLLLKSQIKSQNIWVKSSNLFTSSDFGFLK